MISRDVGDADLHTGRAGAIMWNFRHFWTDSTRGWGGRFFDHRVSNATAEELACRIRSIKSAARGFRRFENGRLRILDFCGELNMLPERSR